LLDETLVMFKSVPGVMEKRKQPLTGEQEIYLPLFDDDNFDEEYSEPLETYVMLCILLQANNYKIEEEEDKESYKTIARIMELGTSRLV
jgi:hypothetical protein